MSNFSLNTDCRSHRCPRRPTVHNYRTEENDTTSWVPRAAILHDWCSQCDDQSARSSFVVLNNFSKALNLFCKNAKLCLLARAQPSRCKGALLCNTGLANKQLIGKACEQNAAASVSCKGKERSVSEALLFLRSIYQGHACQQHLAFEVSRVSRLEKSTT